MNITFNFINLDRSQERKNFMQKQFNAHKIKCARFNGSDGRKLKLGELHKNGLITQKLKQILVQEKGHHTIFNLNWLGCAMSHIRLWRNIAKCPNANKIFVIFEDDNLLFPNFSQSIKQRLNEAPKDWDFLYFNKNALKGTNVQNNYLKPQNNAGRGYNSNLGCVAIKPKGAQKILKFLCPYDKSINIDCILRKNFHKFNAYFSINQLTRQHNFPSVRLNY